MNKILLLFTIACTLWSCSDDEPVVRNNDLIGSWNWTITQGGINNMVVGTPSSENKTVILNYNEDLTFSFIENNVVVSQGTYFISTQTYNNGEFIKRVVQYSNYSGIENVVVAGVINFNQESNRLTIDQDVNDGIGSEFEKI